MYVFSLHLLIVIMLLFIVVF